jgi:hypothetical protein
MKCHCCRDGIPYCEKDYQKQFGVKCAYCSRYISGKVLQVSAGLLAWKYKGGHNNENARQYRNKLFLLSELKEH